MTALCLETYKLSSTQKWSLNRVTSTAVFILVCVYRVQIDSTDLHNWQSSLLRYSERLAHKGSGHCGHVEQFLPTGQSVTVLGVWMALQLPISLLTSWGAHSLSGSQTGRQKRWAKQSPCDCCGDQVSYTERFVKGSHWAPRPDNVWRDWLII